MYKQIDCVTSVFLIDCKNKKLCEVNKELFMAMKTVTKKDVAKRVASNLNEKIYTTERFVDAVFTAMREILVEAEDEIRIEIRDFGVFEIKRTKPKPKARNPRSGEIIYVPARRKTHFKAGKIIKESLKRPLND